MSDQKTADEAAIDGLRQFRQQLESNPCCDNCGKASLRGRFNDVQQFVLDDTAKQCWCVHCGVEVRNWEAKYKLLASKLPQDKEGRVLLPGDTVEVLNSEGKPCNVFIVEAITSKGYIADLQAGRNGYVQVMQAGKRTRRKE